MADELPPSEGPQEWRSSRRRQVLAAVALPIIVAAVPDRGRSPEHVAADDASAAPAVRHPARAWRPWGVVAAVGLTLWVVSAVMLSVIGLTDPWVLLGVGSLVGALAGGRRARIRGAGHWVLAWLLVVILAVAFSCAVYFVGLALAPGG